jgi:preprotein translocase subunit SecF
MKTIVTGLNIRFMEKRNHALIFSVTAILISLSAIFLNGLNFGIDFTGGTLVEVGYKQSVNVDKVRKDLAEGGFENSMVQHFGTDKDVLIRLAPAKTAESGSNLSEKISRTLSRDGAEVDLRRVEFVGPQVGGELAEDGGLAVLYSLIAILIYVGFRFEYRFATGSVIALIHDVIITVGVFALLQLEFDLTVLAAVLAVIGYSLNDTIVVYDRIRENFRKMRKGSAEEIIDRSLNQTLSRTLMTSFTTLLVLFSLFVFGGKAINGFAVALIIGIVIGTYSSIYVASTAALMLGVSKEDLMPVKKEGAEFDGRP